MTYYVALDVGVRTLALCIVDQDGEMQLERSLPSDIDKIVECLGEFGGEIEAIGLEAGTLTNNLSYCRFCLLIPWQHTNEMEFSSV